MKAKYYAVCNVSGPISVRLEATTVEEALEEFNRLDKRAAIDDIRTDVEDDFNIKNADDMTEFEFELELYHSGLRHVVSLEQPSIANGWNLYFNKQGGPRS